MDRWSGTTASERQTWRVRASRALGATWAATGATWVPTSPPMSPYNAAQQRLRSRSHRWSRQFSSPSAFQAKSQVDPQLAPGTGAAAPRRSHRCTSFVSPAHIVVAQLDPLGTTPMASAPRPVLIVPLPVPALATARCDAASHPAARRLSWPSSAAAGTAASAERSVTPSGTSWDVETPNRLATSSSPRARSSTATAVRRRAAGYPPRRTGAGIRSSIVTLT
jgi:hypothetical protein